MVASDALTRPAPEGRVDPVLPGGGMFDWGAFERAELASEPYETMIVPSFIAPPALARINADFPDIKTPTTFMLEELSYGPGFAAMVEGLRSDAFARLVSDKFGLDVTMLPRMFSVRKFAEPSDGAIHTDSATKILTVLIYFNTEWTQPGGRLRVLRSSHDIDDYAAEIVPVDGNLFAFRRSERSWHGFSPATGERRSLQMQYVSPKRHERGVVHKHSLRKRLRRAIVGLFD